MRRQQPPQEAAPSAYFTAPMQPPRGFLPEGGGGSNRPKKGWGERLRLSRPDRDRDSPQNLLAEYRNKYGTLSSGSALSKSMKYAETWLYGSVSVRHHGPGILLCPQAPQQSVTVVQATCSCADFVTGTQRMKRTPSSGVMCKKCGDTKLLWTPAVMAGGTVRGTLRLGGGAVVHPRVRPSLVNIAAPPVASTSPQPPPHKATTPDPYDLMRRSRLGSSILADGPSQGFPERTRAKSTSPRRRVTRSPSPPTARLPQYSPDMGRRSRRDLIWDQDVLDPTTDASKRKSILECDVNAYELIAKYLRNNNNNVASPSTEDAGIQQCGNNQNNYRPSSFDSVNSDDDILDELSDDLSDNAVEIDLFTKNQLSANCSNAQTPDHKTTSPTEKANAIPAKKSPGVATIGGQSIRIFSSKSSHSYGKADDEYADDSDVNTSKLKKTCQEQPASHIPRPKRPPRKQKSVNADKNRAQQSEAVCSEMESSLRGRIAGNGSGMPMDGSIIKSILKKPSCCPAPVAVAHTFCDTIPKPDSCSTAPIHSPSPVNSPNVATAHDFYLPTFQEFKQQQRKKKQVQFKVVTEDCVPVAHTEPSAVEKAVNDGQGEAGPVAAQEEEATHLLAVTETTSKSEHFEECVKDVAATQAAPSASAENTPSEHPVADIKKAERGTIVTLRRTHSERLSGGSTTGDGANRLHHKQLFNDTMRLRLRTSSRPDSRLLFDIATPNSSPPKRPQRMLSPGPTARPRERPPPPPPQSQVSAPGTPPSPQTPVSELPLPQLPKRQIFPFTREELDDINIRKKNAAKCDLVSMADGMNCGGLEEELPKVKEKKTKSRPNSWSPSHLTTLSPDDNCLDMKQEMINNMKKKGHRYSDPGPGLSSFNLHVQDAPTFVKTDIPVVSAQACDKNAKEEEEETLIRTIVTVPPAAADVHRLQITTDPVTYQIEVSPHPERRTSILINGGDTSSLSSHDGITSSPSKSSVIIEDSSCSSIRDENKVTINVGGIDERCENIVRNSSCTVIDTSCTNQSSFRIADPNQIVIPVSPASPVTKEQKTTLVILEHCSNVKVNGEPGDEKTVFNPSTVLIVDGDTEENASSISNVVIGGDSVVISSNMELLDEDTEAILNDPVEAVKRNLIPHVCGKTDNDNVPSAVDRLTSLIHQSDETTASENLKETDYYLTASNTTKYLENSQDLRELLRSDSVLTDNSDNNDMTSSSCDDVTTKNESETTTNLVPSRPHFVIIEKETQDVEVELRNNTNANEDNLYETIKDHIYEEIPDTPPPLPLSPPPSLEDMDEDKRASRSIFEGASKYDILSYLEGAKERGIVPEESDYGGSNNGDADADADADADDVTEAAKESLGDLSSRVSHLSNTSDSSEDSCNLIISNIVADQGSQNKVRKSSAEIERNDSGVGSETSKSSRSRWQPVPAGGLREDQQLLCEDCDQRVETQVTESGVVFAPLVCRKCGKKRAERKEIIAEIVDTEEKYGRDLQIILDEFYRPMLVAGLLTPDQLSAIFLNVEELLENALALAEKLRDTLDIAVEQGDEDLLTVNMGKLFVEAAPMLHAFESYCTRQGAASMLLANLEKEKELLRIFLRVSQMENAVLRRMNLNSFLMVPVQRVTKYPLLLARLYKVTPPHHEGREQLRQAQHKIELHLEHMNSEAKDVTTTKLWRRISIINVRRPSSETDMIIIKLRKMALDILEWNHDEVRFCMEGKLFYMNPTDNNWRRGRTVKLNPINAVLVTKGKPMEDYPLEPPEEPLRFARKNGIQEATLLLVKEKCGRYSLLRDPLYLDKCIVCCDTEWEDYFEIQELTSKDTYIFRGEDSERTKAWYRQLQYHAQGLGAWRRRRNALANIMINGMLTRS